jgi:hypothetical protein
LVILSGFFETISQVIENIMDILSIM